jgi:hypothetical protein
LFNKLHPAMYLYAGPIEKLVEAIDELIVLRGAAEQALEQNWDTHMPVPRAILCEDHHEDLVLEYIQSCLLATLRKQNVTLSNHGKPVEWPELRIMASRLVWPEWIDRWEEELTALRGAD